MHQFETKIYKLKAVIDVKNNTLEQCQKQLQQMIQNCWQRVRSVDYQSLFRSPANSLLPGHLWSFCQLPGDEPSFISLNRDSYGVPGSSLSFLPQPVLLRITCNGLFCCQNCFAQNKEWNLVNKEWKVLAEPNFYHGSDQSALGLSFIFFPCCLF